jgi:YggT family protein
VGLLIGQLLDLYSVLIIAAVVLSWLRLDPRNPLVAMIRTLTEPVLEPVRRLLPPMGGLDFSPMVVLLVVQALRGVFR